MPPSWLTWAIIAFWLAMTGWLTYQPYSLGQRAGEPPPFTIDLTDEIGANEISWNVLINGKKQGQAYSSIKPNRRRDGFKLRSWFKFDEAILPLLAMGKVDSLYRVNQEGELLEFQVQILGVKDQVPFAEITGKVENGTIKPQVSVALLGKHSWKEIKVARRFLNPMHLVNKVGGLREGREWPIQLLELNWGTMGLPHVTAKVSAETLSWSGRDVACFLIEYREPRKQEVHARTWVRQRDGLVLQQQAEYMCRKLHFH